MLTILDTAIVAFSVIIGWELAKWFIKAIWQKAQSS